MSAIYFARAGDYVKIGFSSNPTRRMKGLLKGRITIPDDLDRSTPVDLILVVPFCTMRDERNMQMLFGNHWVTGEWYRWSDAFAHQMQTMQFVTDAVRRKHMRQVRKELGLAGTAHVKENHFGQQVTEHLAEWHGQATA